MLKRLICLTAIFATLCLSIVSAGAQSTGATFYSDINYVRNDVTLDVGRYTLAQLNAAGIRNDDISSIIVPSGYTVRVYQHDNFGGIYWTFKSNVSNMVNYGCNDVMSSVVISKVPTYADLRFTNISISSTTPTQINYTYTIKNTGNATIPSLYNVSIQNFYSANTIFNDAGDVAAGGRILAVNRSLAPGETYTGTYAAHGAIPNGKPYITAKIDWGNIVTESNENNNIFAIYAR